MAWNDEPPGAKRQTNSSWADAPPPKKENGPSSAMSAVRKGLQGATGGFSDEIAGGVEAAGQVVGLKGLGGPLKNISIDSPTLDPVELSAAYERGRNLERENLKRDSQFNPTVSTVSEIAGGFASPINKVTKGLSVAGQGATMGAAYGAGSSEADTLAGTAWDATKGAAMGYGSGKLFDKAAQVIGPKINQLSSNVANKISPASAKANKDQIIAAADRLGIKVTPAMLDDTGFVERLEYTLSNSPSFLGQRVNRAQKQAYESLQSAVKEATKDATNLTEFQVGERVKSGITSKVGERLDPISSVFNEVKKSTKFIPISQKSKDAIIRNIQNTDEYVLTGGAGKANQYVEMLNRAQNADQVKTMMTMLNSDIQAAQGAERQVLMTIRSKLGNLENNSITRAAIAQAKDAASSRNLGLSKVSDAEIFSNEIPKGVKIGKQHISEIESGLESAFNYRLNNVDDVFYAVKNNKVVGHIGLDDTGSVKTVYVDPKYRKQGIAEDLYSKVANDRGFINSDELYAMEPSAINLWEKLSKKYPKLVKKTEEGFTLHKPKESNTKIDKTIANEGKKIVSDLKEARQGYRKLMTDLGETAQDARLGKTYGPSGFLDKVESIPSERLQQRLFNTDNQRQLQNLAKNFPDEFALLRQGKLRDIAESAVGEQGQTSVKKFLNQVEKLSPEAQEIVFANNGQLLDDLFTLNNALPRNFNPSGSGTQAGWQEALYSNVRDLPNYLLYKGATTNLGKKVATTLNDGVGNVVRDVSAKGVKSLSAPVARAEGTLFSEVANKTRIADGEKEDVAALKGPDKWAAEGAKNLISLGIPENQVNELKKTEKGKALLYEAQSAKPTSPRMKSIINRINPDLAMGIEKLEKIDQSPEFSQALQKFAQSKQGQEILKRVGDFDNELVLSTILENIKKTKEFKQSMKGGNDVG